jgi:hypothetical protein
VDGKERQAEGYARFVLKLRGQGRKPGPAKGTGGRPRKGVKRDPIEEMRLAALAALGEDDASIL